MELVLKGCPKCLRLKEFWLRNASEDGFFCKCGYHLKMRNYHGAAFADSFIAQLPASPSLEGILELAGQEHLYFDDTSLRKKLASFNFDNLSEHQLHEIVDILIENHDVYRFRKKLGQFEEAEVMLREIAKLNPRIDIQSLREYLVNFALPLSENEIIKMEKTIEQNFYHPEIDVVTEW